MQKFFTDGVKLWLFRRHTENISQDQWCSLLFSGFGCWGEFSSMQFFVIVSNCLFQHTYCICSHMELCLYNTGSYTTIPFKIYNVELFETNIQWTLNIVIEHWYWKLYIFQFSQEFLATRSPCVCDFRPNAWWDALFKRLIFIQMLSSLKILRYLFHYFHIIYWFLPMISYS